MKLFETLINSYFFSYTTKGKRKPITKSIAKYTSIYFRCEDLHYTFYPETMGKVVFNPNTNESTNLDLTDPEYSQVMKAYRYLKNRRIKNETI